MGSNVNTLQHMLEHCQTIGEYLDEANTKTLKDFTASRIVQDAVVMRLLALGELTTNLPPRPDFFAQTKSVCLISTKLQQEC